MGSLAAGEALDVELFPVGAKNVVRTWLARGDRAHDARNVEEMLVMQIFGETVAAPRPAAHRERERQPVVEAAAGRERMRLLDDHAAYRHFETEPADMRIVVAVNAARVAVSHVRINVTQRIEGVVEIGRAIDGQHG